MTGSAADTTSLLPPNATPVERALEALTRRLDDIPVPLRDLVNVEEQLQYARRFYNGAVRDYNDATQRFPDLAVARIAGFGAEDFFEAGEAQRAAVHVELP